MREYECGKFPLRNKFSYLTKVAVIGNIVFTYTYACNMQRYRKFAKRFFATIHAQKVKRIT